MFATEWVDAKEFRRQLGIGRTKQWQLMKAGVLKPAIHYLRTDIGSRAALKFNVPACLLALCCRTQS